MEKERKEEYQRAAAAASAQDSRTETFIMDFNTLNSLPAKLMHSWNKQLYSH